MDTFVGRAHRLQWTNDTGVAVASGDVVVLTDCIGIAVTDIASLKAGAVEVDGVHDLAADSAAPFTFGQQLWWDPTLLKLYTAESTGRVPAGMSAEIKATAGTKCEVMLNLNTVGRADIYGTDYVANVVYFEDFMGSGYAAATPPPNWTAIDVHTAGAPTIVQAGDNGGSVEMKAAVNDEVEVVGLSKNDKLMFDIDSLVAFTCRFKAPTLAAVDHFLVGMATAYNVDPDSMAAGAWIRAIADQSIVCESDGDGAEDNDDLDSGLDAGNSVWGRILIDFSDTADVKFYLSVNDPTVPLARVQAATLFDLSNYTAGLQPLMFAHKTGGVAQNALVCGYVGIIGAR